MTSSYETGPFLPKANRLYASLPGTSLRDPGVLPSYLLTGWVNRYRLRVLAGLESRHFQYTAYGVFMTGNQGNSVMGYLLMRAVLGAKTELGVTGLGND